NKEHELECHHPLSCNGRCIRHKARKQVGLGRYAAGQKRCQICEVFLQWDGLFCPCCSYRLRTKPRSMKYKTKLKPTNFEVRLV
ncbi:MAG TPA: hypothetical protein VEL11_03680, partial [Candidatus Bathyarchaeia archaeon]|nr:hypothetical protein [Candidatus Bathyarchaeia archaeon]